MIYVFWIVASLLSVTVLALAVFVATRPDKCRYERTAAVAAPPEVVFGIVNDLTRWRSWSPYDKRDPAMKVSLSGPAAGPGASYTWDGNGQVGEGRMTITEAAPDERVTMRLQFERPFKCDNVVNFLIAPAAGGGSRVTWAMDGNNTLVGKAMSAVINMDKMIGKDFEQGLANLDMVARAEANKPAPAAA
jgi:uncharacterized protein YndB with AHSA1/START domain